MRAPDRREFLRLSALGLAGLAACSRDEAGSLPSSIGSPMPSPHASSTMTNELRWERIDAHGPSARRDHTLTAGMHRGREAVFLFGGRAGGKPLDDLWVLDLRSRRWTELRAEDGPAPRFGHNAASAQDLLHVFGGQGQGDEFFNDLWILDSDDRKWKRHRNTPGPGDPPDREGPPAKRYGAGGCRVNFRDIYISHGFTSDGRFDDTWRAINGLHDLLWSDVTPKRGPTPVKRCLHRLASASELDELVLFGGQTDGTPFLGDTWLFHLDNRRWREVKPASSPAARNLFAFGATRKSVYLFGGRSSDGPMNDVWRFDGASWTQLDPAGKAPLPRAGIEGAVLGDSMLMFGGSDGERELDDLWMLTGLE